MPAPIGEDYNRYGHSFPTLPVWHRWSRRTEATTTGSTATVVALWWRAPHAYGTRRMCGAVIPKTRRAHAERRWKAPSGALLLMRTLALNPVQAGLCSSDGVGLSPLPRPGHLVDVITDIEVVALFESDA